MISAGIKFCNNFLLSGGREKTSRCMEIWPDVSIKCTGLGINWQAALLETSTASVSSPVNSIDPPFSSCNIMQ